MGFGLMDTYLRGLTIVAVTGIQTQDVGTKPGSRDRSKHDPNRQRFCFDMIVLCTILNLESVAVLLQQSNIVFK